MRPRIKVTRRVLRRRMLRKNFPPNTTHRSSNIIKNGVTTNRRNTGIVRNFRLIRIVFTRNGNQPEGVFNAKGVTITGRRVFFTDGRDQEPEVSRNCLEVATIGGQPRFVRQGPGVTVVTRNGITLLMLEGLFNSKRVNVPMNFGTAVWGKGLTEVTTAL